MIIVIVVDIFVIIVMDFYGDDTSHKNYFPLEKDFLLARTETEDKSLKINDHLMSPKTVCRCWR